MRFHPVTDATISLKKVIKLAEIIQMWQAKDIHVLAVNENIFGENEKDLQLERHKTAEFYALSNRFFLLRGSVFIVVSVENVHRMLFDFDHVRG